ncbi:MAG: glucose-6-phosphate isomerase [Pseudomonadaceae bacterium]|nr:glucose-6-phosphate isomerase [Pseudomonadaceae bacterium]
MTNTQSGGARPSELPAWQELAQLAASIADVPSIELTKQRHTNPASTIDVAGLHIDFSKQRINDSIATTLVLLAQQSGLADAIDAQFRGDHINNSENRAVLHSALRAPKNKRPASVADSIENEQQRLLEFAESVRSTQLRGFTGKAFTDVVHIGIGGSHLGPELVYRALGPGDGPSVHFVANVDGAALAELLPKLDPERTLVTIVSKSFTTAETKANADSMRSWFIERTGRPDAIASHFCAVSTNLDAIDEFGLDRNRVFTMWDWVGGRYSVWSSVGLPIALALGREGFLSFLNGAHAMDDHFCHADWSENAPVQMALSSIWNTNFLGATSLAVLPYDRRLALLPDFLQQLDMESNGKRVHRDGSDVTINTATVLWGGEETNGQHAFHQQLHQGTQSFSADFLAVIEPDHPRQEHHNALLANCLAQSQAMLLGRETDEAHRRVPGSRATTTILLAALTPYTMGALLALYEQKVFCQGVIWQINSFDQWGVELGKQLAEPILAALVDDSSKTNTGDAQDPSTQALLAQIEQKRNHHE